MNKSQAIAIVVAALNLGLTMLFPPYDYIALQHGNIPTFDGFYFVFADNPNRRINSDFLSLETIVILINACIAWLLLQDRPIGKKSLGGNRYQRAVLWFVACNLLLVILFPPFQNYTAITQAALPSFEGFYFLFADNSQRQLVAAILYLEVCLLLANGAILWLLFRKSESETLTAQEIGEMAEIIRATQRKK